MYKEYKIVEISRGSTSISQTLNFLKKNNYTVKVYQPDKDFITLHAYKKFSILDRILRFFNVRNK